MASLVDTFAPPTTAGNGAHGMTERPGNGIDFLLHETPGTGRQKTCQRRDRGVGAVAD